jgi:hypothetical protein
MTIPDRGPAYTPGTPEYLARVTAEAKLVKDNYDSIPKLGPRGGRYTLGKTASGRSYRRYF